MKQLLCAIFLFCFVNVDIFPNNPVINSIPLNTDWLFLKEDIGSAWEAVRPAAPESPESVPMWQKVQIPHCYNALDGVDPDLNYYQGPAWYKTQLAIRNPYTNGRIILHFEGVGQQADVYIFTTKVGSHIGGYDEWSVDITDAVKAFMNTTVCKKQLKGLVPLAVHCDNSRNAERIPSTMSDFNVYGGIYRPVSLNYIPAISFKNLKIEASCDVKGLKGQLAISADIQNWSTCDSAQVCVKVYSPKGEIVVDKKVQLTNFKANRQIFINVELKKPSLWSTDVPQLYRCEIEMTSSTGTIQETEKVGFRNFEFLNKGPFLLNGSRHLLRGTHRHEDHAGVGAAMTDKLIKQEMQLMKDMGVNFIRLGHYQQSKTVLNLCDSLGILVWEEIPWCRGGLGGEQYKEQARHMLTNMIQQHQHHPSIILWGLGNENDWPGDFPDFDKQKIMDFMSELNVLSHQLDATRKTSIRRCDFCKDIPDVYSPSIWAGWYRGVYTEYKDITEKEVQRVPHFFHAEWGGDSHAGRHSESPDSILSLIKTGNGCDERLGDATRTGGDSRVAKDGDWSESYICNLFDWHLKEQEDMPYLSGSAFWVFKDFATPLRPNNPIPYVNQKGVVERDLTPKESYYVFQSRWTEKPMVHIYGHSWPTRWGNTGEQKMVKVYSNCDQAELFVNGKSQGVKKRDIHAFPAMGLHWNVVFASGANTLKVIARKGKTTITDEIHQNYQTEKWGTPAQMSLQKIAQNGDTATIEVRLLDAKKVLCLNARKQVVFGLNGDGKLLDNLGTVSGSRKLESQNGRATIRVKLNNGQNIASVKCDGLRTIFCEL